MNNTIEPLLTESILEFAAHLATKTNARAVLVYSDAAGDIETVKKMIPSTTEMNYIFITKSPQSSAATNSRTKQIIEVPDIHLTRMGQVKIAVLMGLSQGMLSREDRIVCLSGIAGSGYLDLIIFMDIAKEFEMFAVSTDKPLKERINPEVFNHVLAIAVSLGNEGHEGKPVGTTFVIGDISEIQPLCQQMILNPFKGHPREQRKIFNQDVVSTIREFSSIDGAFLISHDGIVETASTYLKPLLAAKNMPRGLGARHLSAAGITSSTSAVAITVSETTGVVTVYIRGEIFVEIESPRRIGSRTRESDEFYGPDYIHGGIKQND